jgi:predicted nucleic acid-binding protein
LTETEAALFRHTELLPETRQVLAEMLLSKQLISKEEYDETLCSCSDSAAQAEAGSQHATPSILGPNENGEPGRLKSFSDWIASILPGGGQTSDLDFGTIQPSPMWPQGDHAARTRAQTKPAADELITLLKTKGILTETEAALFRHTELLPETRQVLAEMLLSKHLISRKEYDRTLCSCSNSAAPD